MLEAVLGAWLSSHSHGLLYLPEHQFTPLSFPVQYNTPTSPHTHTTCLVNFYFVQVHLFWISYRVWLISIGDRQANLGLNPGSAHARCGTLDKSLRLSSLSFLICKMVMIISLSSWDSYKEQRRKCIKVLSTDAHGKCQIPISHYCCSSWFPDFCFHHSFQGMLCFLPDKLESGESYLKLFGSRVNTRIWSPSCVLSFLQERHAWSTAWVLWDLLSVGILSGILSLCGCLCYVVCVCLHTSDCVYAYLWV